jgi:hypothetical protein
MFRAIIFLGALLLPAIGLAQQVTPPPPAPAGIQDNSFLIEEAYNQESGVVQHIQTFMRTGSGNWISTFTQEWPVFSLKHQLGFTVAGQSLSDGQQTARGLGDVALNYRYQLTGDPEAKLLIAPRFSLLIPRGNAQKGLGSGGVGYQVNLPVTTVIAPKLVMHWNAGATLTPNAQNTTGDRARTLSYNLGHSAIWLAKPSFHFVFETAWNRTSLVAGPQQIEKSDSLLLNPGVRWAHNFKNGLQVVPGVAVPVGVGASRGVNGVFLYISFEHAVARFGNKS